MADLNTTTLDIPQTVQKITLISMEGDRISLQKNQIQHSHLLQTLVAGNPNDHLEIPLRHIRHVTLDRVVKWMKHHDQSNPPKDIEKPLRSAFLYQLVDQWDSDLVELSLDQLFELLMAANYMHVKALVELVSAKIAIVFKGKNPEQLRKALGVTKDFTPEEEAAVLNDHRLLDDA